MGVNVLLTVERDGKAIAVGRVKDRQTVVRVARRCIREKRLEVAEVGRVLPNAPQKFSKGMWHMTDPFREVFSR